MMGDVLLVYRIHPKEVEDLPKIREKIGTSIPNVAKLKSMEEEPLAFGYKILKLSVIVPDEEGAQERVEEALRGIEEIDSFEVELSTLI